MNRFKIISPVLLVFFSINACHQNNQDNSAYHRESNPDSEYLTEYTAETLESDDSVTANFTDTEPTGSSASHQKTVENQQLVRKIIKKADVSMEVKDVYESTQKIENKVTELGGLVENSNLETSTFFEKTYPISTDSAVEVKKYSVSNLMTVRIPENELANFLNLINQEIVFLNARRISAEDISNNFYLSQLEQERSSTTAGKLDKLSVDNGKIDDRKSVIMAADNQQKNINNQIVNQLNMNNKVAYSTVSLLLSEKDKVAETPVVNLKNYEDKYKPGFGSQVAKSLTNGYDLFLSILYGLIYLWPLWSFAGIGFLMFKMIRKKSATV